MQLQAILRKLTAWVPPRALAFYDLRKSRALEREHLEEFRHFYHRLEDKQDIYYMFFTSGLLQWASRALSFVPASVNVVLIGSNLEPEELAWIAAHIRRPFHHVRLLTDDKTIWEFLFEVNEHNFGWLDVDCFILNPGLFQEMTKIDPDVVANTTWLFKAPGGADVLCTFFVFLNAAVIRAVNHRIPVLPVTYSYRLIMRPGRPSPYALCDIPSARITKLLRTVLPSVGKKPVYPRVNEAFFDTLHVYQLVANALGYRLNPVRSLAPAEQHSSSELVHVGKVSYYRRWKVHKDAGQAAVYSLLSQLDYALLSDMGHDLPPLYSRLKDDTQSELTRLGLSREVDEIKSMACKMMVSAGADPSAISRIVGLDETAWRSHLEMDFPVDAPARVPIPNSPSA